MQIRKATKNDIPSIVSIMNEAKAYFKENQIPQWQNANGYPNEIDVQKDIDANGAWVVTHQDRVVAYSFIREYMEPNYLHIEGKWLNNDPYAVVHRTCVENSMKGKHISGMFIEKAKDICKENGISSIRVDTHEKNISMQKMLEKHGFIKTGIIYVEDGSPRFAYQLII